MKILAVLAFLIVQLVHSSDADCAPPKYPAHSRSKMTLARIKGRYMEGTVWLLRCKVGFRKTGSLIRRCKGGIWSGKKYACISTSADKNRAFKTSCPGLAVPPGAIRYGKSCCAPGSRFSYRCKQGLRMAGARRIKCLDNGLWSSEPPTCRRIHICAEPSPIENGHIEFKKTYPRIAGYGPGDTARYKCNPGYYLVNHTYFQDVTCTRRGGWTEQPDTCVKLYCYLPNPPSNGFIIAENKTRFESGDRIRYGCKERYELVDIAERFCDDLSKGWDSWDPLCREIRCPDPGHPENGRRVGTNFSIGDTVKFVCMSGFHLKGSESRTCLSTRQWNGTLTTCQDGRSYCPNPGIPVGGSKRGRRYNRGDVVKFQCEAGFYLSGSAERECLINRAWSGSKTSCNYERGRDDPKEAAQRLMEDFDALAISSVDADDSEPADNTTDVLDFSRSLSLSHKAGLDIYFVFDVSGSINQSEFKLAVNFASVLMDKIGMSRRVGGTRIGILSFDSKVNVLLRPFDPDVKNVTDAKKRLQRITLTGGSTATADALKELYYNLIPTATNNINPVPKQAVILITDGESNMAGNPALRAKKLKGEPYYVDFYCVGLGSGVNKKELIEMAGPEQTIVLDSAEKLHFVTDWFLTGEADYTECGISWEGGLPGSDELQDGWFSSDIREWPWMVSLYHDRFQTGDSKQFQFFCGGTLIAPQWVLTAAHCFESERNNPQYLQVRMGNLNRTDKSVMEDVAKIYPHELYKFGREGKDNFAYDIALMQLVNPVKLNPKIRTICLPNNVSDNLIKDWYAPDWKERYVLGWGSNETVKPGHRSMPVEILKTISIPIATNVTCIQSLRRHRDREKLFVDGMFCAGDGKGKDSCDRDSGGPLLIKVPDDSRGIRKAYQLGIVSWSLPGCRQPDQYGFYTKVSDYTDWIADLIAD